MEEILNKMNEMKNLDIEREKLKEKEKQVANQKHEVESMYKKISMLHGVEKEIKQKEVEVEEKEFEKMKNEEKLEKEELIQKFNAAKKGILSEIDKKMSEYIRKEEYEKNSKEIENKIKENEKVVSEAEKRKSDYEKIALKMQESINKINEEINKGDLTNIEKLKELYAMRENSMKAYKSADLDWKSKIGEREKIQELQNIQNNKIVIEDNIQEYSDLEYLRMRMGGLHLDNFKEVLEKDSFIQKYKEKNKENPLFSYENNEIHNSDNREQDKREKIRNRVTNNFKKQNDEIAINIGNKGKIIINGKKFKIPEKAIKEGINVDISNEKEVNKFLEENVFNYIVPDTERVLLQIKTMIKDGILDTTVLKAINSTKMSDKEKQEVFMKYANGANRACHGKEPKSVEITYDMKKLSKTRFFRRFIKAGEGCLDEQEKAKILGRALKSERFGIGKIKGELKQKIGAKLLAAIEGEEIPLLPVYSKEELHEVANIYNESRYDGEKKRERSEFKEKLEVQINDEKDELSKEQQAELSHLAKTQDGVTINNEQDEELE